MKTISTALKAHLAQDVTTVATCWKINRTDGVVFSFTDHDQDVTIGGVTYLASTGYKRTAMKSDVSMSVDNMDVMGILSDNAINAIDLKTGKFDYAQVQVFLFNWANTSQGILRLRAGFLGEVTVSETGTFQAELRGLSQALVTETSNQYQPTCRADLGDSKCKIAISPDIWRPETTYPVTTVVRDPNSTGIGSIVAYEAIGAGTSNATPPAWNNAIGATTYETGAGTPTWRTVTGYLGRATVTSVTTKKQFTCDAFPPAPTDDGNQACVEFAKRGDDSTQNVTVAIYDGTSLHGYVVPNNLAHKDAASNLAGQINGGGQAVSAVAVAGVVTITKPQNAAGYYLTVSQTSGNVIITQFGDDYYNGGVVMFQTGQNAGFNMEILEYVPGNSAVSLVLSMPFPIAVGDVFLYYPGCDKRRKTCFYKFNNIPNFRGEPDVPGWDTVTDYPDAQ